MRTNFWPVSAFMTVKVPGRADPATWGTLNARLQAMSAQVLAQQAVANAGGVVNVPMIFRYQ